MKTLGVLVVLVGCAGLGKPKTLGEQVKALQDNKDWLGQLDGDYTPVSKKLGAAWSTRSGDSMEFAGVDGDQMCATWQGNSQVTDTVNVSMQEYNDVATRVHVAWSAYDSLAAIPATFAPDPKVSNGTMIDHRVEDTKHVRNDLSVDKTQRMFATIKWCAPAPAVTASTRFLVLSTYGDEGNAFVWQLASAPAAAPAGPADAPKGDTSTTEAPVAGAPTPSEAPAGTVNLIDAMKQDSRLEPFLKVVAAAGKTEELKSGGPFTIIAPLGYYFENVLSKDESKALYNNKAKALALYQRVVAKGVVSRDTVLAKQTVPLAALDGHAITMAATSSQVSANGTNTEDKTLLAKNGVVYLVVAPIK